MPEPVLTLTVTNGELTTQVPVTTQASPGPSGFEAFTYVDAPPPRHPEIDASALRSVAALHAFLLTLVRGDQGETPVWILEPRMARLRQLLGIPLDAREFEIVL